MLSGEFKFALVNVNGDHRRAQSGRDLHAEAAHPAHAHPDRDIVGAEASTTDGFPGSGYGVGHDREQSVFDSRRQRFGHGAETSSQDANMGGESSVTVIAGHELMAADGWTSRQAGGARAAGNHGGNDDGAIKPGRSLVAGGDNTPADFMAEHERQSFPRRNAIHGKADIGMADAAARDFDDHLFRRGFERRELPALERLTSRDQAITMGSANMGSVNPHDLPHGRCERGISAG